MNLDEIAIRVAEGMPNGFIFSEPCDHETGILISEVTEFARRLLAEVQKLQEPVAWDIRWKDDDSKFSIKYAPVVSEAQYAMPLYLHPAPAVPVLHDIEQYRMQMAGISAAAIGYWKEGESIHPDYDTLALRDVAKLYAKYEELYKATHPVPAAPKGTS